MLASMGTTPLPNDVRPPPPSWLQGCSALPLPQSCFCAASLQMGTEIPQIEAEKNLKIGTESCKSGAKPHNLGPKSCKLGLKYCKLGQKTPHTYPEILQIRLKSCKLRPKSHKLRLKSCKFGLKSHKLVLKFCKLSSRSWKFGQNPANWA